MVVGAVGVLREFVVVGAFGQAFLGVVVEQYRHHRFGPVHQLARVEALVEVVGHVGHLAVAISVEPVFQARGFLFQKLRPRHAAKVEAQFGGFGFDEVGAFLLDEVGGGHLFNGALRKTCLITAL